MAKEQAEFTITELYGGKVQIKFYEKSHQYWVSVKGGPFKRVSGVTTIIGIKDKSTALGKWQQQVTCDFLLDLIAKGVKIDEATAIESVVQHELQRDNAADIGKEIHGWIEHHIRHKLKQKGFEGLPPMPNFPEAITGINAFFAWEKEHKVKFLSTEKVVYSLKHGYIGTMDFTAMIDGELCAGDFKSSSGLYNGIRMQTAAYGRADEEEQGKKLYKGRWGVRLNKYTEAEHIKREERKAVIRNHINRIQGKEEKEYPIKPYEIFEAYYLDAEKTHMDRDFDAFVHAKALFNWDKETDSFHNAGNW